MGRVMLRRIQIIANDNVTVLYDGYFNSEELTDSQQLHNVLCDFDPGDDYAVMFSGRTNERRKKH